MDPVRRDEVEYREILIPLGLSAGAPAGGATLQGALRRAAALVGPAATRLIEARIEGERGLGWAADQSIDLTNLLAANQVDWRQTGGFLFRWTFSFDSARVRLRRPIETAELAEGSGNTASDPICRQCAAEGRKEARWCASCGVYLACATRGQQGEITCSFCGLRRSQVRRLVAGRDAAICDECSALIQGVFRGYGADR